MHKVTITHKNLLFQTFIVDGRVAGYIKNVRKMRHVVFKDSGHSVPRNQPEAALEMFRGFIEHVKQCKNGNCP